MYPDTTQHLRLCGFSGMGQVTYWSCVASWNSSWSCSTCFTVAVQKHDYLGALKTSQGQRTRDGRTAVQGITQWQKTKQIRKSSTGYNVLQRLWTVIDISSTFEFCHSLALQWYSIDYWAVHDKEVQVTSDQCWEQWNMDHGNLWNHRPAIWADACDLQAGANLTALVNVRW